MSDLSPKALTEEKSLWQIYKKSRRISTNRFNFYATLVFFLLTVLNYCSLTDDLVGKLENVRKYSEYFLTLIATILGFLIAGFTIFATISQPDMLVAMSRHREEKSDLSFLKNNFFVFIRVFIYYLSYSAFCVFLIVFAVRGGIFHSVVKLSPISREIYEFLIGSAYIGLFTGVFFLFMQLKSFIFNVYHSVMTAVRWKAIQS